jgi:hypothetical protein
MQYNQPYGISDTNASYINGNPSTGTMGSIPPAFSIEHPQREIVTVIQWAFDHGYIDMLGNLCEAPTSTLTDQLLKALFGIMNSRLLRAPQTYYVNGATGNDNNNGLTTSTAFKTIQQALNTAITWNQNGFGVTINVAAGVYAGIVLPQLNGTGGCTLIGSSTGSCTISGVNQSAILSYESTGGYDISNFTLTCAGVGQPGDHMCGIQVQGPSSNSIHDVKFLNCGEAHMMAVSGATLTPSNGIEIAGSAGCHIWAEWNGHYTNDQMPYLPVLTISQAVAFNSFAQSTNASFMMCNYKSIIGAGNVTAGKYYVANNSVMNTNGGGANYLPGNSAGLVTTGGQYA